MVQLRLDQGYTLFLSVPGLHPYVEVLRIHNDNQSLMLGMFLVHIARMHHLTVVYLTHHVNHHTLPHLLDIDHNIPLGLTYDIQIEVSRLDYLLS